MAIKISPLVFIFLSFSSSSSILFFDYEDDDGTMGPK